MPQVERRWNTWLLFVVFLFIFTGSIDTILAKLADTAVAFGHPFNHPFVQGSCVYIGEAWSLLAYFVLKKLRRMQSCDRLAEEDTEQHPPFNPLIFVFPTLCDLVVIVVNYTGLALTNAASYQMLRGGVIIFTTLLSIVFLHKSISVSKWIGVIVVCCGLLVVGLSDFLQSKADEFSDTNGVIAGDLLIVLVQLVAAVELVYEEKYVVKYNVVPTLAVGLEGVFGIPMMTAAIIIAYFIRVSPQFSKDPEGRLENALDAFSQIGANHVILLCLLGLIISLPIYNVCGVTITKNLSALTRKVSDSTCTIVVWMVSIALGWQKFAYLQLIGFLILISGMMIYHDVSVQLASRWLKTKDKTCHKSGLKPLLNGKSSTKECIPLQSTCCI